MYYRIQHAKSAPFKCIKNCHSFITILQSSVLINECDHTMKLFFYEVTSMIELGAGQKAVSA